MGAPCHASGVMKYKQFVRPNPNMSIDLYLYQLHRAPRAMNIFSPPGRDWPATLSGVAAEIEIGRSNVIDVYVVNEVLHFLAEEGR